MYKIVIIDDEPLVTRWLQEKVAWKLWDCEIIGVGKNGIEGKALVDTHKPDIVISDVKMPGLNGLELSKHIRDQHPKTLVLILSGFDEFDYVQTALRNDVFDYLLKPVDIEELRCSIFRACAHLNQLSDAERRNYLSAKKLEESSQLTESRILMSLMMNGNQELETIMVKMQRLDLEIISGQITIYEPHYMDEIEKWGPLYQFAVQNILQETYQRNQCNPQIFYIESRCVVVVKFALDVPVSLWAQRMEQIAVEGLENVKQYLKLNLSVGIGPVFRTIDECHAAYRKALKSLEEGVFWSKGSVFSIRCYSPGADEPTFTVDPVLYEHIEKNDYKAAEAYLNSLTLRLRMLGETQIVFSICIDMLISLSKIAEKWGRENFLSLISGIKEYRSFDDLMRTMKEITYSLCLWIEEKRMLARSSLADQAAYYVRENYADPNLNLREIAEQLHVSISHLSRTFVKATGLCFNKFITQVRLDHAKYLMENQTWLTNQEIAKRVGFRDGSYFSLVFKKQTGKTPNEHRGKMPPIE